ncbi:Response regulator receiver domain-containing protein [Desulfatibacillum alkenivorans DSM 16219]|jgi:DNA-binding NtrC family response regulator|uniref:Response regulator receiver domain-containing protein n=1 Tax=Desulfatibacillum alkenivorans DSM 16219 TaxID=1121393 RepID=A0A1M6WS34_9BACT|nr:response regulator [Desulfatibacillum alkenivorans]SHK96570.1 Response regulator receiver domain-containing protein [Desulfatibacillum alkenivorans DSM 16219]
MPDYSILLVEDDYYIRNAIARDLQSRGYGVAAASGGEAALELLAVQSFDLVLTDLVMEQVDGLEVLKAAKSRHPDAMVIILTGYGKVSIAIDALRLGADDFLLKPAEPEEIHFRVEKCLQKREFRLRIRAYEEILPICCECKKIRDDRGREPGAGDWMDLEDYLVEREKINVDATLCPACGG